jgi:DNA-binding NarL/FixJ family response regulator
MGWAMDRRAQDGSLPPRRIALVHHSTLVREALCCVLSTDGCRVVWQEEDGIGLVDRLEGHSPDLILLEWDAPGVGSALIEELVASGVDTPIVIMARPDTHDDLSCALRAGAVGCLSANLTTRDFLAALRMLAQGDILVSHEMVPAVTGVDGSERLENRLTPRELEILRALGRGATNQEIADQLFLSPHTVRSMSTRFS